ncbi:sugar phosphate isomerase/epimerase [Isoptericola sp. BMS4]|uniref:sugar phosphate isomerase/epimerase family protein n=1 Tax=Isoptericola sp. BMS4 TaxID=2527875 RepID=UPI001422E0A9|nr:TIM barrel protein [Isoptericola sp. BMS4]
MPLAFSTLGAPGAGPDEIVRLALRNGAAGVELRAGADQPVDVATPAARRAAVRGVFDGAGITVLAVASYVRVCDPGPDHEVVDTLRRHADLAAALGAGALRVFPGAAGAGREGDRRAVARLSRFAALADPAGPRILLETHDSHPRGADVRAVLAALDGVAPGHPCGAIWDVLHPWRDGEAPDHTAAALRPWLEYVQFKDGTPDGVTPLGDGTVPLDEIAALVGERWWSFEWERAWHPHLAPLDVALPAAAAWYRSHVLGRVTPGPPSPR